MVRVRLIYHSTVSGGPAEILGAQLPHDNGFYNRYIVTPTAIWVADAHDNPAEYSAMTGMDDGFDAARRPMGELGTGRNLTSNFNHELRYSRLSSFVTRRRLAQDNTTGVLSWRFRVGNPFSNTFEAEVVSVEPIAANIGTDDMDVYDWIVEQLLLADLKIYGDIEELKRYLFHPNRTCISIQSQLFPEGTTFEQMEGIITDIERPITDGNPLGPFRSLEETEDDIITGNIDRDDPRFRTTIISTETHAGSRVNGTGGTFGDEL